MELSASLYLAASLPAIA